MQIEIYVQARMKSTRLPGKVLMPVLGKPLLAYLVERLKAVKEADRCVILTSTNPADDMIVNYCQQNGLSYFRGSEEDVLGRYYEAANLLKPHAIIRVTADCPLIDPDVIDQLIRLFKGHYPDYDYVSNSLERTFPRGLDAEIFTFNALSKAHEEAKDPKEREHVTMYMYRHPEKFSLKNLTSSETLSQYRWTVDTPEDFALIKLILENLYPTKRDFRLNDILELFKEHPEWMKINAHIQQKP